MRPASSRHPIGLAVAAACAFLLGTPAPADAGPRETYIFVVSRVDLGKKGAPPTIVDQITKQLGSAIDAHADLDGALPADAPDPAVKPEPFKKFLARKRQRAFKVNVEITDYFTAVEAREGRDNLLSVRVSLRLFGETIPDRVMAFTGDGTATVKVEIGKKLRDKDRVYAIDQALELAVADALTTSIQRLREPPPSQQGKKKRKK